jgi:uncharacterized protein
MSNAISMNNPRATASEAWYRQFYVWLVIFLPACAVVASFATLYIAAKNPPELAVESYSSIEATNARNVAQDKEATRLALSGEINFGGTNTAGTGVLLHLQANDMQALPSSIVVRAVHSTQAAQDATAELTGAAGSYGGSIQLPSGNYDIFVEDPEGTWRLTKRVSGKTTAIHLHARGASASNAIQD